MPAYRFAAVFFGIFTYSMAFYAMFIVWFIEQIIRLQSIKFLFWTFLAICCFGIFVSFDDWAYASTLGRVLSTGDKVFDTRSSIYEVEQIGVFNFVYFNDLVGVLFGVGWELPGSGGSFRVWVLGAGIVGVLVHLLSLVICVLRYKISPAMLSFRIPIFLMLFYIWGNWLNVIFLFLLNDGQNKNFKIEKENIDVTL